MRIPLAELTIVACCVLAGMLIANEYPTAEHLARDAREADRVAVEAAIEQCRINAELN